jgi:uncharacterized protein
MDTRLRRAPAGASPWVVDTRAIGLTKRQGPGSAHRLDLTAPAPEQVATGVLQIPVGSDVRVTGLLESVSEGVLASGTASATATGCCGRCLREITVPVRADFRELFAYPDSTTAQTTDPDEVPRLADDNVDLEPLVHDELVLAMPSAPVCSPECRGLCPECGERLESVGPDHRHDRLDPRWAALTGLLDTASEDPAAPAGHTGPGGSAADPRPTGPGVRADDIEEK